MYATLTVMSVKPPRTCYIAGAMSSVPKEQRDTLKEKREAIATFFRDGYSIICSHYKVLYARPENEKPEEPEAEPKSKKRKIAESRPTSNPEYAEPMSIVARDLVLVNTAEIFVMCFEGKGIGSWGAAIELGYAYGCGKPIVIFNLSPGEDTYFFLKYLPQDTNHQMYIVDIKDKKSLKKFTEDYQPEGYSPEKVNDARKELEKVFYPTQT